MSLFQKKIKSINVTRVWSTDPLWGCDSYGVSITIERTLLWFIHWDESFQIAGPFRTKQEARKCMKNYRKKYKLV
jgi:hypothetical protein